MRMRLTLLPKQRTRITWLGMRIVNLEKIFDNLQKNGKKTEFKPARSDHQNVKNQKIFLSENHSQ